MKVFDAGHGATPRFGLPVARVDKPLREEVAGAGRCLLGKSAGGQVVNRDERDGIAVRDVGIWSFSWNLS